MCECGIASDSVTTCSVVRSLTSKVYISDSSSSVNRHYLCISIPAGCA